MAKRARRRRPDETSSKRASAEARRRERSDSKRSQARQNRAQQASAQLQNPAVAHSTYPELGPSVTNADLPVDSVVPQPKHEPMASRGYGVEAQHHIMRSVEGTGTGPHDVPDPVLDVLGSGGGTSLDGSIQRALENRMDADFSNVRIHTGPKAAKAADAIDAKAFTCGNAIVFNSGEYDPIRRKDSIS
ncbi:hypothetical protein Halru_0429 [Halovivax ruber XH-70]|uniref:eCIS core domain-containing protein n=1 Tax=Halovivax ruber (strain DSM 18193 / JCM 13892 / XH-70) TaxID=797302 RepID=L0IA00_HALRX|nr:hypothetical protein Halru_0429 [Halovivax ruber XH-70]